MKIAELSRRSGLSPATLRYYERIGLIPHPDRDGAGHRSYDTKMLAWLEFVGRMKSAGMPIREMLDYARLRAAGHHTSAARADILRARREDVRAHIAELQATLSVLDAKIAFYGTQTDEEDDGSNNRNTP